MTIHDLLDKALALANEGFLAVSEIETHAKSARNAETQLLLRAEHLGAFEASRDAVVLDGTHLSYSMWMEQQRELTRARRELRLLHEALAFLQEEVERQVAIGTHRKAAAAKKPAAAGKEARA